MPTVKSAGPIAVFITLNRKKALSDSASVLNYSSIKFHPDSIFRSSLRLCVATVIFFVGLSAARAQTPGLRIHYFTRMDGIYSAYINSVTQDSTGFIWIGTRSGLYRYDGYEFKAYYSNPDDSTSIPGSNITFLYTDTRGRLWVATTLGICRYDEDLDNFRTMKDFLRFDDLVGRSVDRISEDPDGNLLISSAGYIFRYEEKSGRFSPVLSLESGTIDDFLVGPAGRIWIGCSDPGGLLCYNLSTGKKEPVRVEGKQGEGLNGVTVTSLALHEGKLWIAILGGGISMLDIQSGQLTRYPYHNNDESMAVFVYLDHENRVWTVDYTGLKILDRQSGNFSGYYPRENDPMSVRSALRGIFEDRQGNYWIYHSSEGVGISMRLKGFNDLGYYGEDFLRPSRANITCIQEDAEGKLWLGYSEGGIVVFDWQKWTSVRYAPDENDPYSLGRGSVLCLFRDSKGIMWIGTYRGGLQYFDNSGNRFITYTHDPANANSIAGNDIRSVAEDSGGNLWLAVHGKGIDKFDRKHERFVHYNSGLNGLSNDWTFQVLADHRDEIWAATAWGLSRLPVGERRFRTYFTVPEDTGSLTNNIVSTLYEDGENTLWVGTSSGLNRYNPEPDNFTRFGFGGRNNNIAGILSDRENYLWISNLSGLIRLDPDSRELKTFTSIDGLRSDEYNPRACYKNASNRMYFGGIKGIDLFDPDELVYNTRPPTVLIDRFRIMNRELTPANSDGILTRQISRTDRITIHYTDKVITINYKALNFINPRSNRYAYRLDPLEKKWNEAGTVREVTYTNLKPGDYVFKVIAANNDGIWNKKGAELAIKVLPPWYRTLVFKLLLILFLIGTVIGYTAYRTSNLQKQKALLEMSVQEKTRELSEKNELLRQQTENLNEINKLLVDRQNKLEQQSEELKSQSDSLAKANAELQKLNATKDKLFSIIAHDLTSPFNSLMGFSELLVKQFDGIPDKKKLEYAEFIHNSSEAAYSLLQNLLLWAKSQTNRIKFQPQRVGLLRLIEEVVDWSRGNILAKKIRIGLECDDQAEVIGDQDMIRTILRNLLNNAIKFTPKEGSIKIRVEPENGRMIVSVSNTGAGITEEKIREIMSGETVTPGQGTEGETGSGLGLTLCREFIRIHKGKFEIRGDEGRGSTFTFSLEQASG